MEIIYSDSLRTKINPSSSISEGERLTGVLDFLAASMGRTDQSSLNYWSRPRQNTRGESTNLRQAILRDSNLPDGDIIITHLTSINRVLTRIHRAWPFVAGCRPSYERPTHPRWSINDILFASHPIEQCMDEWKFSCEIMWKKIENLSIKTHWENRRNGAIEVFFCFISIS